MAYGPAPYDVEQWDMDRVAANRRVLAENDAALRAQLAKDYDVPPAFMDLAVRIWWAGKED